MQDYRQIYLHSTCKDLEDIPLCFQLIDSVSHLHLFPLICLAAQYSKSVYRRPSGLERETHVEADRRMGTKAMVMKSVPVDNMNVIIFAIRGTHTFMDWAVNLQSAPTSPEHFLVGHDTPTEDRRLTCHRAIRATCAIPDSFPWLEE